MTDQTCIPQFVTDFKFAIYKTMKKEKMNSVLCCFCNESLNFKNAVQLSVKVDHDSNEVQGLFLSQRIY
jgi:hypothetical protein